MSAITAKASRKMKKYAVLTREPRCFLGSFDFSWEQRKLGDIADIVGGGTPSTGNQSYWDGDIDWYAPAEIADQIYANSSQKKITGLGYENSSAKMLPPGTVLFTSRAGIGKTAILTRKGCTNQGFQSIVPHRGELDSYFIFSRTEELKRYGELVGAGSTFVEVSGKQMAVMELMMPPTMREQQTIGGFFQQLDHLITLHQRKCANLCSPSQVVFSLLFVTSTFSWEQRKLGDISEIKTGPFGSTLHADDYVSDGTPIITTEHFKTGALPRSKNGLPQVSDSDYKRLTAYTLDDGDIVFSRVGSVDINALITPFQSNWLFSGRVLRVRPQTDISSKFLHTRLETESIKTDIRTRAVGQTMPSINTEILKITPLVLPSSAAEQEQIGSYFAALDNLITLHQRECISFTGRADRLILTANKKRTTSSWEQRKLGDIGETYTGLSGKTKADFGHGQARFVTYMNVFSNPISNPEMTEPIEIDPKQNEVEVGDVLFTTSSETPEEVGMSSVLLEKRGKTYLNSFCFGFRPSEKIDSYYLAYMLRSESAREKIILLAQGISRYNISKNKVMEIAVSLPSLDEQKLIGQCFRQLDHLITLHQRKPFLMKWRTSDANRNQTNRLVL